MLESLLPPPSKTEPLPRVKEFRATGELALVAGGIHFCWRESKNFPCLNPTANGFRKTGSARTWNRAGAGCWRTLA
jgi:hypothetical protein